MKRIYLTLQMLLFVSMAFTQNWSNVGSPFLSNGTTSSSFLYFGDMEIDAAGNVFVGYWDYGGKMNFAKNSGSGWSVLPSPGTSAVGADDIEIHGSDYYYSYLGARGSNYYAFVKKYDGSSSWTFVGDSVLIGGTGQGGSFDFLLDNNGVPTIIGLPKTVFGNKTVKQFKGGAWVTTCVIPNSASVLFKDGAAIFDANNKLNCIAGGNITMSGPPYIKYFALGLKIVDSTVTVMGDTIYCNSANGQFRIDNTGNSYLLFNDGIAAAFLSYKLNGSNWTMISDTAGSRAQAIGSMLYADVSNDGKVVFCSQTITAFQKSMFLYSGGVRSKMDTINFNGAAIGGISDIIVHNGDVYILFNESGYTVMKHSLSAATSVQDLSAIDDAINIYPNPAKDQIQIDMGSKGVSAIAVFDMNGRAVLEKEITQQTNTVDVSNLLPGVYFIQARSETGTINKKLLIR